MGLALLEPPAVSLQAVGRSPRTAGDGTSLGNRHSPTRPPQHLHGLPAYCSKARGLPCAVLCGNRAAGGQVPSPGGDGCEGPGPGEGRGAPGWPPEVIWWGGEGGLLLTALGLRQGKAGETFVFPHARLSQSQLASPERHALPPIINKGRRHPGAASHRRADVFLHQWGFKAEPRLLRIDGEAGQRAEWQGIIQWEPRVGFESSNEKADRGRALGLV